MGRSSKCVLVTGGAGYVGSHTVVKLLENCYDVIVIDSLCNAYKGEKKQEPESLLRAQALGGRKVHFYEVDLLNEKDIASVFKKHKIGCVIHFAALKSVSESCSKPLSYYETNISGTLNLLKVMMENGVTKLVYSSSSTVYGLPTSLPLTEEHPTGRGCTNPYGKTKFMVEEILKDLSASNKAWCIISLRYFNPVGAHESGKIGEDPVGTPNNLMPYVAQVAVGRRPSVLVYGADYDTPDGTGVRDYIHIQDLAEGHIKALQKLNAEKLSGFRAYNLGTGRGHSVLEVIKAFSKASGREIPFEIVGRREGDIATSYCNATLAEKELNWVTSLGLPISVRVKALPFPHVSTDSVEVL